MDTLLNAVLNQLASNPALVQMAIGMAISVIVTQLKNKFPALDAAAKDPAQVKWVQILVMGMSLLATLGTAWASGHLAQVDSTTITAFLTTVAAAFTSHDLGSSVKAQVAAKPVAGK